ncbi:DUF397 domain-containing protein [Sphaerisporangium sp. NBC_01403]|uniref:DUF397 domain-containing protein n=1 Tax=Sphaerisporangium sp. NBC_01403 TaxID=2903599 RepID=UPI0032527FF1
MTPRPDDEPRGGWRRSMHSTNGGDCVEVGVLDGRQAAVPRGERLIAFRDSKNPHGPRLYFTPAEWGAFKRWMADGGPALDL